MNQQKDNHLKICIFQQMCCVENYLAIIEKKLPKLMHDADFAAYAHGCSSNLEIAEKIVQEVSSKAYVPGCVDSKPIFFLAGGRKRRRFVYPLQSKDLIVLTLLEKLLLKCLNPKDFDNVYSNILGKNFLHAVKKLSKAFKTNTKDRKLDLYLMNTDITKFYDTVPVDHHSLMWERLKLLYEQNTAPQHLSYIETLIQFGVQPLVSIDNQGTLCQKIRGLPTGSPLAGLLSDIYLKPFDDYFGAIAEGYYIRYVDDVVFVHPNPEVVMKAFNESSEILSTLRLKINSAKTCYLYLTRCARPSSIKEFKAQAYVDFLECRIHANGTISASNKNVRKLLRVVRRRLAATVRLIQSPNFIMDGQVCKQEMTWEQKLSVLIKTVNSTLIPNHPLRAEVVRTILRKSDDRQQLRFIDREILLLLAQYALGKKGIKVLRTISYKEILRMGPIFSFTRFKNGRGDESLFYA